jgi:hypothetical protein
MKTTHLGLFASLVAALFFASQGCGGDDDDAPPSNLTGGTGGTAGSGGTAGTAGSGGTGATDGGGSGGTDSGTCNPKTGQDGCFNCPATTIEFLNQCKAAGVQCQAFQNTQARLPKLLPDGGLPPLQ